MNKVSLQSRTIDILRFPIILGVIFVHNFGSAVEISNIDLLDFSAIDFYDLTRVTISKFLGTIASPFFFFVAGFLFFIRIDNLTKEVYIRKVRNRIMTILIPYLVWNFLAFLVPIFTQVLKGNIDIAIEMIKAFHFNIFWVYSKWELNVSTNYFGNTFFTTGPLNTPLWFMRDLFILILATPIIHWLVQKVKYWTIIILGLCFITRTWTNIPGLGILSVFFFVSGAYFGINKIDFIEVFRKRIWLYILSTIFLLVLNILLYGNQIQVTIFPLFKISFLIAILGSTSILVEKGILRQLHFISQTAFFLYVAHSVSILGVITKLFNYLIPSQNFFSLLLKYFGAPIVTALFCVLSFHLLKRFLPKLFNLMIGSR